MKVCCGNGKPYDSLTEVERTGGCNNDQCMGPIEEYLYLQFCGRFDTAGCISNEELCKLLKEKSK